MKNFPIKINDRNILTGTPEEMVGKTIWNSRAIAVSIFPFIRIKGMWHVAAIKRGKGCPDYVGYWCCPCGYVDFNETIHQAALRELREETGIEYPYVLNLVAIQDNPNISEKQNVTFRYVCDAETVFLWEGDDYVPELTSAHSEPDEVEELKWIPLSEIGKYEWAFDHKEVIFEAFTNQYKTFDNGIFC